MGDRALQQTGARGGTGTAGASEQARRPEEPAGSGAQLLKPAQDPRRHDCDPPPTLQRRQRHRGRLTHTAISDRVRMRIRATQRPCPRTAKPGGGPFRF